ncbi:hypothetical protein VNI00_001827 [Paramarasmius palmivorus]|uniref:Peptidase A1 domain-containing protein n=1 Tax=Paramarasmius palmivorus TaxID=297713 RepID=A0AAW0E1U3_9AGAR
MFSHSSSLLFIVTLALLSSASPILDLGTDPMRNHFGPGPVVIRKRKPFVGDDGVFDLDRAVVQTVRTKNKYRHNLLNLQQNVGRLRAGGVIMPIATVPKAIAERLQLDKRQAEPLEDENDIEWTGSISIGTPGKPFLIDFDMSVAGINATNQHFSPVTTLLSSTFDDAAFDGILGLAYPALSNMRASPFFNTAIAQGSIKNKAFGMKLATNGSELFLGGTNSKLYTGNIEYHQIDTTTGLWEIPRATAFSGPTPVASKISTIIDSGTTIMYGPPADVEAFYSNIPGARLVDRESGFYAYPCGSTPRLSFSWGGRTWTVAAENFNFGTLEIGSSQCVGALAGQDLGLGSGVWLLGDSFMKNVYTAFDFEKNAVGFAQLS